VSACPPFLFLALLSYCPSFSYPPPPVPPHRASAPAHIVGQPGRTARHGHEHSEARHAGAQRRCRAVPRSAAVPASRPRHNPTKRRRVVPCPWARQHGGGGRRPGAEHGVEGMLEDGGGGLRGGGSDSLGGGNDLRRRRPGKTYEGSGPWAAVAPCAGAGEGG